MRGRIAKIEIDRINYTILSEKIILDLDSHCSFPFILRLKDDIFIIPENSESGCSTIYRYKDDNQLEKLHIFSNRPLTDATLLSVNGELYCMSTEVPNHNGNKLSIYKVDINSLTMNDEPIQEISFNSNKGRNAGEVICDGNRFYRPAQDCNGGYGKGIIIQEMTFDKDKFEFNDVCVFRPKGWRHNLGYHTFNTYKGITVIDAHGYRYPILGRVLYPLVELKDCVLKIIKR